MIRFSFLCLIPSLLFAEYRDIPTEPTAGDALLAEYFEIETAKIAENDLTEIQSAEDWRAAKGRYRSELEEMLGLKPMPKRTPLNAVVTGTTDAGEVMIDRLHFQSQPGLYVTANLYRPKQVDAPLPAILYVCGHAKTSFGNKAAYHHHGMWFARNGYVCLTIDSLQLGEIEGVHHGTHRMNRWWWQSRGYTPAGVEAWNCIRALDYMETRTEVDRERIGVTGRSGGGAYSWWITALDDRIKVSAPVAGITSMKNHVVDGVIEGHCDCMFQVNTYRWDFPKLAALAAPRPLLIINTDKDTIFPLDGVVDVYSKTRRIYKLLGQEKNIGLALYEGPHKDTQPLRVPAFHWFERHLKGIDPADEMADTTAPKSLEPEQLRVFESLPKDEINSKIDETFVGRPQIENPIEEDEVPTWADYSKHAMQELRTKSFRAWPEMAPELDVKEVSTGEKDGRRITEFEFLSQEPYRLALQMSLPADAPLEKIGELRLIVCDEKAWEKRNTPTEGQAIAWFAPRGVGPTKWTSDARERTHIRRRFALLGQTLDGMQVWDIRRAVEALSTLSPNAKITLESERRMAGNALYAALFAENVSKLVLKKPPSSHRNGPIYLNVSKTLEMPETVALAAGRVPVVIHTKKPEEWAFVQDMAFALEWEEGRFQIVE